MSELAAEMVDHHGQQSSLDRALEAAQAQLIARYAPGTRVRRIRWSGGETQTLELGAGSPLLLIHGGGANALQWLPIMASLARGRRVIAVDRPGHGLADPFDYRGVDLFEHIESFLGNLLDRLELPTVDIVANSMGGLWSVVYALEAPRRVSRLVLAGAPPGVTRALPLELRLMGTPLIGRKLGQLMLANSTREGGRKFATKLLVARPERLDDAMLDANAVHMRRNVRDIVSLIGSVASLGGLRKHVLLGERWNELAVPTLFLCGQRDVFVDPGVRRAWESIAARNRSVEIAWIPGAGHLPWLDEPERVVGEIDRFLAP